MRRSRPNVTAHGQPKDPRGLDRPVNRLALTLCASVVWIAGYALVTAKAIQIL